MIGCVSALALATPLAKAQEKPESAAPTVAESLASEVQSVFERAQKAIVRIQAVDHHGRLSGTGFFIDPAGTLYTSYTIGGESTELEVQLGDKRFPARRLVADAKSGVAVLKVDAETPFIPTGASKSMKPGSPAMVVGYAMDLPISPSFGCVSGFEIKYLDRFFATRHIRASVPVQRGQGGAPLLNMRGEAVGILISSLDQGSACFSLPIEAAEKVHRDFVKFGEVRGGWLGLGVETSSVAQGGSTALVNLVNPGAPGDRAGLMAGDTLLGLGEHVITSPEDVLDAAFYISAEDEVKVTIDRSGQTMELTVMAGDKPTDALAHSADELPKVMQTESSADLRGFPVKLDR